MTDKPKTYDVFAMIHGTVQFSVEASSPEEAIAKAREDWVEPLNVDWQIDGDTYEAAEMEPL